MNIIDNIASLAGEFDAIVFDQWGVLHDGTSPYSGVIEAINALPHQLQLAILSNSGKRASDNAGRIAQKGYDMSKFSHVMTSGEAFWQSCRAQGPNLGSIYAITAKPDDAKTWARGMDMTFTQDITQAHRILLMGLPEGSDGQSEIETLNIALERKLPLVCTNPDRASPRADRTQVGPGALAHSYQDKGGDVTFYGKPHRPVFESLQRALNVPHNRILMVGDSLEHDISGGHHAGWKTLFIQGGLAASHFPEPHNHDLVQKTIQMLAHQERAPMPDYTIFHVR